jgi:hypothetical protein
MSKIVEALLAFHKNVGPIRELSQAQYGQYADLQTVLAAVTPHLLEQDLVISQTFRGSNLVTQLMHISGEQIESESPLMVDEQRKGNVLHAWGGAVTYQRRYALLAILNLAAGCPDDDADHGDHKMTKQSSKISDDDFL